MTAKDCLQTGCNNCQFCEPGPTVSVFKPGCPFYDDISKGQSKPYTGGDTMPPFPVIHGSMYCEVQTLNECYSTLCTRCAYQLHLIDDHMTINKANCEHKVMMYFAEADEIKSSYPIITDEMNLPFPNKTPKELLSGYIPSSSRTYYYRAHASLKACNREKVCHRDNCYITDELQVHHIDGDISNNKESNLEYLCVDCHSNEHPDRAELILSRRG